MKKTKIIVYGLGKRWEECEESIKKKYDIIGYSDKRISVTDGLNIAPQDLNGYCELCDYIFVTSDKYAKDILLFLTKMGIPLGSILLNDENLNKCISDINKALEKKVDHSSRNSSLTDNFLYTNALRAATESDVFFNSFRSNPIFGWTYEFIGNGFALEYIKQIEKWDEARQYMNEFIKNDEIGNPVRCRFEVFGEVYNIAPVTLRYIKVLSDLVELFDVTEINRIAEIGIGYGGQCRIIKAYPKTKKTQYDLIDLPEVFGLVKKYLNGLNSNDFCTYINGLDEIDISSCDLVISNYAFSELQRVNQEKYLREVIRKARHGYITWSNLSYEQLDGYSLDELLEEIPNSKVIEEIPLTREGNCIIVW